MVKLFLQQQNEVIRLKLEEDLTRYFFTFIKNKRLKQAITQVKDGQGNWKYDQTVIANIFIS